MTFMRSLNVTNLDSLGLPLGFQWMKGKGAQRFWMTGLSAIFTPSPITLGKLTDYQMMCCRVAWLQTRRPLHAGGHRLLTSGIIAAHRAHCVCPPHMAFGTERLLSPRTNDPCLAGECQAFAPFNQLTWRILAVAALLTLEFINN